MNGLVPQIIITLDYTVKRPIKAPNTANENS